MIVKWGEYAIGFSGDKTLKLPFDSNTLSNKDFWHTVEEISFEDSVLLHDAKDEDYGDIGFSGNTVNEVVTVKEGVSYIEPEAFKQPVTPKESYRPVIINFSNNTITDVKTNRKGEARTVKFN